MSTATLHTPAAAVANDIGPGAGDSVFFTPGHAPFQRELIYRRSNDPDDPAVVRTQFPGVLTPQTAGGQLPGLDALLSAAETLGSQPANQQEPVQSDNLDESQLRKLLDASGGALLFRDTPLRTADDFSRFAHVLAKGGNWTYHVDKGLMVVRFVHAPNVATANEGPPHLAIGSHNEYGLSSHFPSYAFFFCVSQPTNGGETPIASSLELYDRLQERAPEFAKVLRDKGVRFTIHHPRDTIQGSLQGNALLKPDAFGPTDGRSTDGLTDEQVHEIVDSNVRALGAEGGWQPDLSPGEAAKLPVWKARGFTAEWLPDGSMLSHQRVPGVRPHPWLGRETFFNNIHNRLYYSEIHGAQAPPHVSKSEQTKQGGPVYQYPPYVAGADAAADPDSPLNPDWIKVLNEVTAEAQVNVAWQPGDVILLDNLSVQHARRPWEGPRKLLASFWDGPK